MRVGFDLDGVAYDWSGAVRKALQQHRGIADVGESTHWDYIKERVPAEDWRWIWTEGLGLVFGQTDAHYPAAPQVMRAVARDNELVICTHRPRNAAAFTAGWIARHKICFEQLHVLGAGVPKSNVWHDMSVVVDDKPEVCTEMLELTRAHVFCPRRAWNVDYKPPAGTSRRFHWYTDVKEVQAWVEK